MSENKDLEMNTGAEVKETGAQISESAEAAGGMEITETSDAAGTDAGNDTHDTEVKEAQTPSSGMNAAPANEIRETTGESVEIYDEDDSIDLHDSKKKKKFKKRFVVIPVLLLLAAGSIFAFINSKKSTTMVVQTQDVALGTIENILSISGTVESAETKSYFSSVAGKIGQLDVKVGDKVKSGSLLYAYDEEALELAKKTAELAIKQAKGNYNALYSKSPTVSEDLKYAQGMTVEQVTERIDAITLQIDALNNLITEKKSRINRTLTDLQKTQSDLNQNGITDTQEQYFDNGNLNYIYRNETDNKKDGQYTDPSESNRQMALAVSQSIQEVTYALNNDPEIKSWSDQITTLKEEQSHLTTARTAMASSFVNSGTATATKAQLESTTLTQEDNIAKYEEAKGGVKADFNGVITAIPDAVKEGASVQAGAMVLTMANLDDVKITIQVSKSDLPKIAVGQDVDITINGRPYQGKVSKISGTATKNNNGVAVVATEIKVANPDSEIILGVEANNKIHAEKAENTIVLPYEYVQTDATGDYVYVVDNGLVARRDVVIGIASSTEAEIKQGLKEGDKVITSDVSTLTEGTPVITQ